MRAEGSTKEIGAPVNDTHKVPAPGDWRASGIRDVMGREELDEMNRRRDGPGIAFFTGHVALMLLTGFALYSALGGIWVIPCLLLHGTVIVYWFQPFHECAHGTAYRTPALNRIVLWTSGILTMLTPTYFYYEHMQHHRYTQHPQRDPERIPMADRLSGYLLYLTALPYFYYMLRGLVLHSAGRFSVAEQEFIPKSKRATVKWEARGLCSIYLAAVVASLMMQTWALCVYWFVPRLLAEPAQRLVRLTEHQGCPLVPDLFTNTRTVLAAMPVRLLGWYACHHAEHHISPNTPFHAMPALSRRLRQHMGRVSQSYLQAHCEIIRHATRANA